MAERELFSSDEKAVITAVMCDPSTTNVDALASLHDKITMERFRSNMAMKRRTSVDEERYNTTMRLMSVYGR